MQRKTTLVSIALIAAGAGAIALAADRPAKIAPPPAFHSNEEMLVTAGTPGMPHRYLNYFVGGWDVAVTMHRPGSPPKELTAQATFNWALDGRFLQEDLAYEIMGERYTMLNYMGYDNFKGRYTVAWLGSSTTSITTALGYQNLDGNEITLFGTIDEPHMNLHDRTVKYVYRSQSQDRFIIEIHDLHIPEPNTMVLSGQYTRQ